MRKKIKIIATLFGLTIAAVLALNLEMFFAPFPEIDTEFTPGFSWEKFGQVQPGMTKAEVKSILGKPFDRLAEFPESPCWYYSRDGKFKFGDFSWISASICFDNELVVEKHRDIYAN